MIYFITKATKTYTLMTFLNTWGKILNPHITLLPVEKLVRQEALFPGTYILTDYDRLNPAQLKAVRNLYAEFKKFPDRYRLINDPELSLDRIPLLNKLFVSGLNPFRCIPSDELPDNLRFPLFIRKGRDHFGKITPLIHDHTNLKDYLETIRREGYKNSEILITEFVDTADEQGVYRKYSAFLLGDKVIPRHIFFSKNWMVKGADLVSRNFLDEEINYLKNNPHEKEILRVFQLAGMQYGRIDYSVKDGRLVVWEINPNPMIASSSSLKKPDRKPAHNWFVSRFCQAFIQLDTVTDQKKTGASPINRLPVREIQNIFPFSGFTYFISNGFQYVKAVLLFNFYTIKNRILK